MADIKITILTKNEKNGVCDKDYSVNVNVTQRVSNCENVDYKYLYDFAFRAAEQQLPLCPDECKNSKNDKIVGHFWRCVTEPSPTAEVDVCLRRYCKANEVQGPFQNHPDDAALRGSGKGGTIITDLPGVIDNTKVNFLQVPDCGACIDATLEFLKDDVDCSNASEVNELRDVAQKRIDLLCELIKCKHPPCKERAEKRDLSVTSTCEKRKLTVNVSFKLCCLRSPPQ